MQVILLKDVKNIGRAGNLITVSDGYANNLLIPKKLGVQATPVELAKYEARKAHDAREIERLKVLAEKLSQEPLQLTLKTGPHGEVFNSITKDDIAKALKKKGCVDITIELDKPLRTIGTHAVTVHFNHGIKATITVIAAMDTVPL